MQISARTDYAVRALLLLAAHEPDLVKVDVITHRQELPRQFVTAILSELRRAGLVRSQRGVDGGYGLARPPQEITIGAVVRVAEGPLEVRGGPADAVNYGVAEHLPEVWAAVRASMEYVLDATTLQDVLSGRLPDHVRRISEVSTPSGPPSGLARPPDPAE